MIRIVLLGALLSIPSASAAWFAYGEREPDSVYDSPVFMWSEPGAADGHRVYFSAYQTTAETVNPNLGILGSHIRAVPERTWNALLAVWTDCNGDGYVGLAESALDQYPLTLLSPSDLAVCPDGTPHNRGGWVVEAIPIGTNLWGSADSLDDEPNVERDPRMIVDNDAAVWADAGLPGAPRDGQHAAAGLISSHTAMPRPVASTGDPAASWTACAKQIPDVQPRLFPRGTEDPSGVLHVVTICDAEDGVVDTAYNALAVDGHLDNWDVKTSADATFNFSAQKRGAVELGVAAGDGIVSPEMPPTFGISAFNYWNPLGAVPARGVSPGHGSLWHADQADASGPQLAFGREGLIPSPDHWTFYAHVSLASGALPGGRGTYGVPACQVIGAGAAIANGWACDPDRWYATPWGPMKEPHHLGRLGESYQLRDVDCWDGTLWSANGFDPGYPSQFESADCNTEQTS